METRVSKYRDYRNAIIKQDSVTIEEKNLGDKDFRSTGILSLDQVMKAVDENDKSDEIAKKRINKKILKYILITFLTLLVIAGLVVLGIFAWR